MRTPLIVLGLVASLAIPNWAIWRKEQLLQRGDVALLELAPVDPRSLIQGDYMRLDYAITRGIQDRGSWSRDGRIVVTLAPDGVARFVRLHNPVVPLAPGERLLQYRKRGARVRVGSDAFFFQEGTARKYAGARYGELRVDADGGSVLVGLRDADRNPIR